MSGKLSLVATPIGNLGDITLRAIETLRAADVVACEDTRRTRILLDHLEIKKPMVSLHEHNEARRSGELLERIERGDHVALVSDAGHPLVSDPGERFLHRAIAAGAETEVLPGACSVATALTGAGLPATPFYFGGFLPPKSGRRQREWEAALLREHTSVFFESPHRIAKSLGEIAALSPERLVVVARELTKKFEEFRRGTATELAAHYTEKPAKGEITLLVSGTDLPKYMGWPQP